VTVVGYRMTRGALPIFQILGQVFRRGVRVRLLFDQVGEQMETFLSLWPLKGDYPEIYDKASKGTLHAKVVLVDGLDMLVTSANLTKYALHSNIEVGVRIRGPTVFQLDTLLNSLVRTGHFTMVRPDLSKIQ
jgi:phosphatidylserine/phosphatidylglycerophosphate/cardiolipin synthase-like enzyme